MSTVFSLKGKVLKLDTESDIAQHIQGLQANEEVEEIDFGGNTLGIGAAKALADTLGTKAKLKIARLADIFTGRLREEIPPALTHLLDALLKCPLLHTIDLSDNAFGPTAQQPLITFFSQHEPLEHIYLQNNGLGPEAGTKIATALTALAKRKQQQQSAPSLKTIVCGRNRLENGSMAAWAECYAAHQTLKHVRMVQNGIRPEGITTLLVAGLSHCRQLQTLDLQDNTFTRTAARSLATTITRWPQLLQLGVGDCLLSARGGVMLAEALALGLNPNLQTLRLQYNGIDSKGLSALVSAIRKSLPHLTLLELNGNRFADDSDLLEDLRTLFEERGNGELDELDELESEDEDEDEDEERQETLDHDIIQDADNAEDENVPLEANDKDVDKLAASLAASLI